MSHPKAFVLALSLALPLFGHGGGTGQSPSPPSSQAAAAATDEGIPVADPLVIAKCGTCHNKDAKGNLSRISWERTTPEGWQQAIKRMVRLNGLSLTPEEARAIVKSLSATHGLAPEEAKPVMYIPEHRILDETNIPDETVREACATCHPFGRPLSWRRSKDDWRLLANMHTALFPHAFFRGIGAPGGGGRGGGNAASRNAERVNAAIDYLAKTAPLHTPEWSAWRARMREPKLTGRWLLSAYVAGRGNFIGEMIVEPGEASGEFKTQVKLLSVKTGTTLTRSGQAVLYAGYSWRGRSQAGSRAATPDDLSSEMREVMWFSPEQPTAEGRWFWGDYQEFGMDVKLQRAISEPTLTGIDHYSLKRGSQAVQVRLYGDSLPQNLAAADLDFGSGVKVRRIVSRTAAQVVAELDVAADAVLGKRDVLVNRSVLPGALAIYDRIDYIKVVPEGAVARLGGARFPKGYQQFEAIAYQRGSTNKLPSSFDINIGPVDVTWSVEEFMEVNGDDDKDFVGKLDPTGLFTPALEGPNPQRKFGRNNYGNVWIVATAKGEKDKLDMPMIGKAYLVVTVPMYVMWDQPEIYSSTGRRPQ
jgi:quinohemoprotein amine dehydrogenase